MNSSIFAPFGESVAGSVASALAITHRSTMEDFVRNRLSDVHQIEAGGDI